MTLTTTEEISKYLRGKSQPLEILTYAQDLLLNDAFFPNKNTFILTLLFDRINDFSSFKSWKFELKVWDVLYSVYISSPLSIRSKLFRKIRFIDILIEIINKNIFPSLFIDLVYSEGLISLDESSAISLLSSYLASNTISESNSTIIISLFHIPQLKANYAPTKKHYTKFITLCAARILTLINSNNLDFKKLLLNVLFDKSMHSHLKQNIALLLPQLALEEKILVFNLVVENVKDIKFCEDVFLVFIGKVVENPQGGNIDEVDGAKVDGKTINGADGAKKRRNDKKNLSKENGSSKDSISPDSQLLIERLLAILSKGNKALSYDFFKAIYTQEIERETVQWDVINYIFELDVELAMEFSSILLKVPESYRLKLFKTILQSYIKGREMSDFFIQIWLPAIKENDLWGNERFVDLAANSIDKFSSSQLIELINQLFTLKNDVLPLFTSITKGLISCPTLKIEQVKETLLSHLDFFLDSSVDSLWEVRYYLLCLYQSEAGIDKIDFNSKNALLNEYYYYCIFRSIEIQNSDKFVKKYQKNFMKFVTANTSIIPTILNRWIVILELFFEKDNLTEFVNIVFQDQSVSYFIDYFSSMGAAYFEQEKLSSHALDYIVKNCEKNTELIELFKYFPIQSYNKFTKKKSLDVLLDIATKSEVTKLSPRIAILHILTQPTFQSKLESNLVDLIELLDTSDRVSKDVSISICELVWSNNLKQCTNEENKKFIKDSISSLTKSFKKNPATDIIPTTLLVSSIVIPILNLFTIEDEKLNAKISKLKLAYYKSIKESIKINMKQDTLDFNNVDWLVKTLTLTLTADELPSVELLEIATSIGGNILSTTKGIDNIKQNIFQLLTKIYPAKFHESVFILSLYFVLKSTLGFDLDKDLSFYLSRLSSDQEEYFNSFEFVLNSTKDLTKENSGVFASIITSFISNLSKQEELDSKLFVLSLSTILSNFDLFSLEAVSQILFTLDVCLSTKAWLLQQYALETTISIISKVAELLKDELLGEFASTIYIQSTKVMSSVLLFHRYKLSTRHHLIIKTFVALLEPLCLKNTNVSISNSKETAAAYSRLVSNLCENTSNEVSKDSLSSTSALMKKAIRKHLPMLLINYIYFNLKFNFNHIVQEELSSGIYSILNVLSQTELQLVSSSLDIPGKSYYRTLYSTYKEHGKWKDN